MAALIALLLPALQSEAAAQTDTTTIYACYSSATGSVYRIKADGLRTSCTSTQHIEFSFNAQGPIGVTGPAGATGAQGPQGEAGPAGQTGPTGPQGETGATGAQGPQGEAGPAGPQGETGATGATGAQGPQGEAGPAGETGPAGPQGEQGPAGADGDDGVVATNANGAYDLTNNNGWVATGTAGTGNIPVTGAGRRAMWYPARGAFRAGTVTGSAWDDGSVGENSVAFGLDAIANSDRAFAINGIASAQRAFAVNSTASGVGSVAIGRDAQATNDGSIALGETALSQGLSSVAIGLGIARGDFGVAIGLKASASGTFSVAIGRSARTANRQGALVLGDGCVTFSSDSVYATANNQVVIRGCGGVKIYTNQTLSAGVELAPGGGSWSTISDRNRKENFLAIDGEEILSRLRSIPMSSWNYLSQDRAIRHLGPMAQDFHAAFGLGESNLLISTVDIDGVNMAGVQALDGRTLQQAARIRSLEAEVATQARQIAELRAHLTRIEALLTSPP
ncbi:MAG TPA: tail fiber domain-containing protein [Longimicrobium sp.]|nr:tail fiber domain-containing protein [Longimicrobium sp.]